MGVFGNLAPLVILFLFVGGAGWVGYQVSSPSSCYLLKYCDHDVLTMRPDLSLHRTTRRARRQEDGEKERGVHKGWRKGGRQGGQG